MTIPVIFFRQEVGSLGFKQVHPPVPGGQFVPKNTMLTEHPKYSWLIISFVTSTMLKEGSYYLLSYPLNGWEFQFHTHKVSYPVLASIIQTALNSSKTGDYKHNGEIIVIEH